MAHKGGGGGAAQLSSCLDQSLPALLGLALEGVELGLQVDCMHAHEGLSMGKRK